MTSRSRNPTGSYANSPILSQLTNMQWRNGDKVGPQRNSIRLVQSASAKHDARRPAFSPKPRLFALIIAINNYLCPEEGFSSLRGAEPDALSFKEYLEVYLDVPPERITVIRGQHATRSNMISAFQKLERDSRIQPGDPIVIFYAGHGSEAPARETWEAGGPDRKIQMLIPYDCSKNPARRVPAIPDYTIGALIDRIARVKGDNITVIFDCCNSASGTRGPNNSDIRVRSVALDDMAYYDQRIDQDILYDGARGCKPAPQYEHGGLKSHVFLAACGSEELARESNGHGDFSRSLLNLMKSVPPEELRYCDILEKMERIPNQNPHCEGYNKQRFLFDTKVRPEVPERFPIRYEALGTTPTETYQLVLEAGTAQGIVDGSHFREVRQGAKLKVVYVEPFKSILHYEPGFQLDQPSVAELIHVGRREDLRLYVASSDLFRVLFKRAHAHPAYRFKYSLDNVKVVDNPAIAHLSARASSNGREVVFDLMDARATHYGFNHRFGRVEADVESVAFVLGNACRFFRSLDLSKRPQAEGGGPISIQFYQLQESQTDYDESGESVLYPSGPDLCRDGIIDFVVNENAPYGFKLINHGPHDFYASAFYYDFSDLSIKQYLQGPVVTNNYKPDYCLPKRRGSLTIGYGSGGVRPMSFELHGRDMDFGFLKVIFASKAIDLSHLSQPSPFAYTRSAKEWERKGGGIWASILVPVVQRRYPAS